MNVKETLEQVPVDPGAEERAWTVVRAAYARHEPVRVRRVRWPAAAAVAFAVAVVAAALSPPGRAVVDAVRRSIGVERAAPALFRLPGPGRVLVSGSGGTWVVAADGSKRRLGTYAQAAWSPHGLYVVASGDDQLVTLEPASGDVHWTLARPGVAFPRWGGTRTDTRIAYLSGGSLHVVAGDGTGDVALRRAARVAPAWQPERHVVAFATANGLGIAIADVDAKKVLAVRSARNVRQLAWSPDGKQLVAVTPNVVDLWRRGDHLQLRFAGVRAVAFARDGRLALLQRRNVIVLGQSEAETVFKAPPGASPAGLAWSPDGRWLLTALPSADQWIFIGGRRLQAVSHIARQFGGGVSLDGWVRGA